MTVEISTAIEGRAVPSWDHLVAEWKSADFAENFSAWAKADAAAQVDTHYGEGSLRRYAEEVGAKLATVQKARWVATRWPQKLGPAQLFGS